MNTRRSLLGALLLVTACISRGSSGGGGGTEDASTTPDSTVSPDGTVTPDGTVSDRARVDVACATTRAAENTAARCSDGLDNDCNGFADCDDFACQTCAVPTCLTNNAVRLRDGGTCMCGAQQENTTALCSDGLDNDCDGFTDCQDFSCQSCSVSVCLADGGLNRGGDAGFCLCRGEENTNTACGDGVDNDCNGFTDCNDFSCSRSDGGVTVCGSTTRDAGRSCDATGSENSNAACGDGVDNDCDGFIDCNDFDCSRNSMVTVCGASDAGTRCDAGGSENTSATCGDGIDNDCDGFIDCNDFSCRTCGITACVRDGGVTLRDGGVCTCRGEESSNAACGDGVDNDCNGFVDCNDFSCSRSDGGTVTVCGTDASADVSSADVSSSSDLGRD